ncbi:MAG: Ig-like domain-containing protein [Planctomycetaceae bacterium]|nr:Ig-like domain-containing protein [Planctomycetaceae bacterium]
MFSLRRNFLVVLLLAGSSLLSRPAAAFEEAEGFGQAVTGGRGGTVYHVTNLNDSGAGSLRNAGSMSNVTIVFDVGGYINISSKLGFTGTNMTIAGQTAPGGIGVKGAGCSIGADNIIIRHMRFRPGKASSASDALNINNYVGGCIVDHCSIQFSTDENNSMDKPASTTVQWTINAWGLQTHSCGSLLYANNTTVHHTLWAHNHTRNPKSRDGLLDWVNNVIFDWDIPFIAADADSGTHWANVDRCYFISGASGQNRAFTSAQVDISGNPTYHMWLNQTLTDFDTDGILDGTDKGYGVISGSVEKMPTRYAAAPQVVTQDALTAYKLVLSLAGATPWERDEVDTLLISDVKNQTRRIIERQSDLPGISNSGFGTLGGQSTPVDTDGDGMPNYFELAIGTSVTQASNNGDHDGDGVTNLEEYIDWLGRPHASTPTDTTVDVDLTKYTAGFAASAVYSVSDAVNGTVSLLADGKTARFTPLAGHSGFASFNFTVNDGSVATINVSVLVLGQASASPISPNPMTWAVPPAATGVQSIAMQATSAVAGNGAQYFFTCTGGNGHDSGWQSGTSYTDTGLSPNTEYTYTVKARDAFTLAETDASAAALAVTPLLPPVSAPAAYWRLDEGSGLAAYDSSGNGNTGTLQGTVPPAWTNGVLGSALSYASATDGGVYVPSSPTIDFGDQDMSVAFWLKQPTTMAEGQEEILIKGTITDGKRYEFYHKKTSADNHFRFCIDDNVVKSEISRPSAAFCKGEWVHVVGVRDTVSNVLRLYANGILQGTAADGTGSISQPDPLYIGDAVMVGSIDDVKIFDTALTADQVMTLYLDDTRTCPTANLDAIGTIDFNDFTLLANEWQFAGQLLPADINDDGMVDMADLLILVNCWIADL